jgi:triphosphoribosyl-dephospho-CoA synthase
MPLADDAVHALIEEIDLEGAPGRAQDRDRGRLRWAAKALYPGFEAMAAAARRTGEPTQALREELGAIGRSTEWTAMRAGCGVRTHRGAIWALGLHVAAAALEPGGDRLAVAAAAKRLAGLRDRLAPLRASHGSTVSTTYGAAGARGEARAGFPHVRRALDVLGKSRKDGVAESQARLDALLRIMSSLQDTELLYDGGPPALRLVQNGARAAVEAGGMATAEGRAAVSALDAQVRERGLRPGGSAPLLAAALFVDGLGATDMAGMAGMAGAGARLSRV